MDLAPSCLVVLLSLWIHVGCMSGMHPEEGAVPHLSRQDVLLLEGDNDPKCFTRTEDDFTCFFETPDKKPYEFYYMIDEEKRCNVSIQRTEEGTFLHVCSFPPSDIYLFVFIRLTVVETSSNTTLYTRTVSVEDHVLLDPPVNVSLRHTDQPRQLQMEWHMAKEWENKVHYGIRYSSKSLGEKTKERIKVEKHNFRGERKPVHTLASLVPGELVHVQMRVKHGYGDNTGHWSHWSQPAYAMVPQSADDILLMCYTADLQNITCQWNENTYGESTYNPFFKIGLSDTCGWRECLIDDNSSAVCHFHGDQSGDIWVKLSGGMGPDPLDRTFYSQPFTLNSTIKTAAPGHLKDILESRRLCLAWEAPLLVLAAHLQYQIRYQPGGGGTWMTVSLKGPETQTCLEVPTGSHYIIQVRSKPNGSFYSGHWSNWSHAITGDIPSDIGSYLILCIPLMMMVVAVVFISLFPKYLSKVKLYLWPPVPNLDKVLQGFLTDINSQTWDPPSTAKQCSEETPASVVELMSEEEPSGDPTQLLCPGRGTSEMDQVEGMSPPPQVGLEVSPDYVTLNTEKTVPGQKVNKYIYEQVDDCRGLGLRNNEVFPTMCPHSCASRPTSSGFHSDSCTDILNQSYLLLAEPTDRLDYRVAATRGTGNLYTNLEDMTNNKG